MKVLVTGAGGSIGRQLLKGLQSRGVAVAGLARHAAPEEAVAACDLTSPKAVLDAFAQARPELVIHAAGSLLGEDPARAVEGYTNNVLSTANVLRAAIEHGARRLVFLSSNMAYGGGYEVRDGGEQESRPENWYARSKVVCEEMLRDHSAAIESLALRLPTVLGPGMAGSRNLVTDLARSLRETGGMVVHGEGRARRQFVDVRDLVGLVHAYAEREPAGSGFTLTSVVGRPATIREVAELVGRVSGAEGRVRFDPSRPERPDQFVDTAILERTLECDLPTGLEDSIRAALDSRPAGGKKVTLLVPTMNEIEGMKAIMPRINRDWVDEILVVDGGTDGTCEYAVEHGYRVIKQKSKGLVGAYREGVEAAIGDYILTFSPDGNSVPEVIPPLVAKVKEGGYDMVIASRYLPGATSEDDDAVTAFGNWMFTAIINVLFGAKYTDTLCMMRVWTKDLFYKSVDIKVLRAGLEPSMCIRAAKHKLKVAEIPGDEPLRIGGIRKMSPILNGSGIVVNIILEFFSKD